MGSRCSVVALELYATDPTTQARARGFQGRASGPSPKALPGQALVPHASGNKAGEKWGYCVEEGVRISSTASITPGVGRLLA